MKRVLSWFACLVVLLIYTGLSSAAEGLSAIGPESSSDRAIVFGGDHDYPPYEYINEKGEAAGFHIDLIRAVCEAVGRRVNVQLKDWSEVRRGLENTGDIDVVAMFYLPEREAVVDFSEPHSIEYSQIFVRKNNSSIHSFEDLAGKTIIIMRGSFTEDYFKSHPLNATFVLVDTEPEALRLLSASEYDAALVGQYVGRKVLQRYRLSNITTAGTPVLPREYCLAVAEGRRGLLKDLNMGLRIVKATGKFEEIHQKWFGDLSAEGWPLRKIARYGAVVLGPLLLLIGLTLTWTWSLKKQVHQRTKELQNELAERKLAEQGLRDSKAELNELNVQFKTILEGISINITLVDPDLRIVWTNLAPSAESRSGSDESDREYCRSVCGRSTARCSDCPVVQCFEKSEYSESLITSADERKWEVRVFPLKTPEGETERAIIMASDITEKVRLQVEASISNRLASLGILAAGVAHEINNPNGLILLHIPMLQKCFEEVLPILNRHFDDPEDVYIAGLPYYRFQEEVPRIFLDVQDSARRIRQIVEDLKNFARENPMNAMEPVNVNDAVQVAVRLARHAIDKATDYFDASYGENLPPVKGNIQQLEQLMVNLIMNACEAVPDRTRPISITTGMDAGARINIIRVIDRGAGMDPETVGHAMDPFFTTRREKGGTGLGLSICSRIVKEHGGTIRIESVPDKQTCVTVCLPFMSEEAAQ